jgi:hypothetical protein
MGKVCQDLSSRFVTGSKHQDTKPTLGCFGNSYGWLNFIAKAEKQQKITKNCKNRKRNKKSDLKEKAC